jgi:hypothetical protein
VVEKAQSMAVAADGEVNVKRKPKEDDETQAARLGRSSAPGRNRISAVQRAGFPTGGAATA